MKATIEDLQKYLDKLPKKSNGALQSLSLDQKVAIGRACKEIKDIKKIVTDTKLRRPQIKEYIETYDFNKKENPSNIFFPEDIDSDAAEDVAESSSNESKEVKRLNVILPAELYKEMRIYCIRKDTTVMDFVTELIRKELKI
jgi:hypothetical protein